MTEKQKELVAKPSVLIQPRLRALSTRLLYSCDINADAKGRIINTLVKLKNNGLEEQTVKIVGYYRNYLAVNVSKTSSIFDNSLRQLRKKMMMIPRNCRDYHLSVRDSVRQTE